MRCLPAMFHCWKRRMVSTKRRIPRSNYGSTKLPSSRDRSMRKRLQVSERSHVKQYRNEKGLGEPEERRVKESGVRKRGGEVWGIEGQGKGADGEGKGELRGAGGGGRKVGEGRRGEERGDGRRGARGPTEEPELEPAPSSPSLLLPATAGFTRSHYPDGSHSPDLTIFRICR